MKALLGALVGGALGFFIPFWLAQRYVAKGGDPTAAGAFAIFPIITVPIGIAFGAMIAVVVAKK